MIKNKVK